MAHLWSEGLSNPCEAAAHTGHRPGAKGELRPSGHTHDGLPQHFLRFAPEDAALPDRDRLVLLLLPRQERDAAQMVSQEGGFKHVTMVANGDHSTTVVDEILTSIGRTPAVQGLHMEKVGVARDVETGIEVADFLRTPPEIICTTAHCEAGTNRDNWCG